MRFKIFIIQKRNKNSRPPIGPPKSTEKSLPPVVSDLGHLCLYTSSYFFIWLSFFDRSNIRHILIGWFTRDSLIQYDQSISNGHYHSIDNWMRPQLRISFICYVVCRQTLIDFSNIEFKNYLSVVNSLFLIIKKIIINNNIYSEKSYYWKDDSFIY